MKTSQFKRFSFFELRLYSKTLEKIKTRNNNRDNKKKFHNGILHMI